MSKCRITLSSLQKTVRKDEFDMLDSSLVCFFTCKEIDQKSGTAFVSVDLNQGIMFLLAFVVF